MSSNGYIQLCDYTAMLLHHLRLHTSDMTFTSTVAPGVQLDNYSQHQSNFSFHATLTFKHAANIARQLNLYRPQKAPLPTNQSINQFNSIQSHGNLINFSFHERGERRPRNSPVDAIYFSLPLSSLLATGFMLRTPDR